MFIIEAARLIVAEQRWSKGRSTAAEFSNFAPGCRVHELTSRMLSHRLPLIEALTNVSKPQPWPSPSP